MITEGRYKTYWDVAFSCKSVHPRTLEYPCDKNATKDEKSSAELRQTSRNNKNTSNKSGYPQVIRAVKLEQLAQKKYFKGTPNSGPLEIFQI